MVPIIIFKRILMSDLHVNFRTDHDHYLGCALAPIELIQYGDFQCEYCADFYPVVKALQKAFGDLLKFVFRHMHDMIYANQQYVTRGSFNEQQKGRSGKFR
jgi:hypothetical protein